MMIYIVAVIASLAFGLAVVAVFGDTWLLAMRAELQRRELDEAFSHGYRAGREDAKR